MAGRETSFNRKKVNFRHVRAKRIRLKKKNYVPMTVAKKKNKNERRIELIAKRKAERKE